MEYYDGNEWVNITSTSPEVQTGGTRGVFGGGFDQPNTYSNAVDYLTSNPKFINFLQLFNIQE